MIYSEEKCDFLTVPKDFTLVYGISGDFCFTSNSILEELYELGVTEQLNMLYARGIAGEALRTDATQWNSEINLVIKDNCYDKVKLEDVQTAIRAMRKLNLKKIAIPKTGFNLGFNHIKWESIRKTLFDVYNDTDTQILVCDRLVSLS